MKKGYLIFFFNFLLISIGSGQNSITELLNIIDEKHYSGNEVDDDQDTCRKIEPIWNKNYNKNDKKPRTELELKIIRELSTKSFNKERIIKGENVYGVIKDGSCGIYKALDIFMDCEDSSPDTKAYGWTGDSYVTENKNVHLMFCIVDGVNFERTNFDYALVRLSSKLDYGISEFVRFFDNENGSDNTNKVLIDGVEVTGWYAQENYFGSDTRLDFYYFPKTNEYNPFPILPISYGVFGRIGNYQGYIYTDDEDGNIIDPNINWITKYMFDEDYYFYRTYYDDNSIPNIIDVSKNTRLYISKVTECSY